MNPQRIRKSTPDQYLPETVQDRVVEGKGGIEAAYDDFKNMNLKTATSAEALKFFRYQVAKEMLGTENKPFVDVGMSPESVIQMARKSGRVDDNAMKFEVQQRFQDWGADIQQSVPQEVRGTGGVVPIKKVKK